MELGLIGLGRTGAHMAQRPLRAGHSVVGYARHASTVQSRFQEGAISAWASSLADIVNQLAEPCAIWLIVPAASVDATLVELVPFLTPGDIVFDGGNSYYRDDIRRAAELAKHGIHCLDVGTSGGVWGLERGYCLMIGGYDFHLPDVAEVWRRGSMIASWLLDLMASALLKSPQLADFGGRVSDSGEGRWTITAAIDEAVPVPVVSNALFERFSSRGETDFADKLLAAMRSEFGGHLEKAEEGAS